MIIFDLLITFICLGIILHHIIKLLLSGKNRAGLVIIDCLKIVFIFFIVYFLVFSFLMLTIYELFNDMGFFFPILSFSGVIAIFVAHKYYRLIMNAGKPTAGNRSSQATKKAFSGTAAASPREKRPADVKNTVAEARKDANAGLKTGQAAPVQRPVKVKHCKHCGAKINLSTGICSGCSKRAIGVSLIRGFRRPQL